MDCSYIFRCTLFISCIKNNFDKIILYSIIFFKEGSNISTWKGCPLISSWSTAAKCLKSNRKAYLFRCVCQTEYEIIFYLLSSTSSHYVKFLVLHITASINIKVWYTFRLTGPVINIRMYKKPELRERPYNFKEGYGFFLR